MATNLNVVALTGNLVRDPEMKAGGAVCSLRIAVNDRRKVGDEWQEVAGFYDVTCFGKTAEIAEKYLSKGRPIAVAGRLSFREWEKDGQKRNAVEIIANDIQFLGSKDDHAPASTPDDDPDF